MAKNSKVVQVKIKEYYSDLVKQRRCCFCQSDISLLHFNAVSCSKECYKKSRAIAEKQIRGLSCLICDEELPASRNSGGSTLCGKEPCKKEAAWRRNLFRVHHIRADQFYTMAESQKWCCPICKEPLMFLIDGSKPNINVDHDHACCPGRFGCGKCVRGITCNGCNGGMGLFRDSPENLIAAAEYLISYKKRKEND